MNGIVANPTPSRAPSLNPRVVRGLLLLACCVLSVALVGAVHTRPFDAVRHVPPPAAMQSHVDTTASAYEALPASFRLPASPASPVTLAPANLSPAKLSPAAAGRILDDVAKVVGSIRSPVKKMLEPPALPLKPAPAFEVRLMEVTAYCPCKKCCGPRAQGITASGKRVTHNGGKFVAADRILPFNTKLVIPGYNNGAAVPVLDRGGAIKGNKLDVYFPTHHEARQWGRRWVPVTVLN